MVSTWKYHETIGLYMNSSRGSSINTPLGPSQLSVVSESHELLPASKVRTMYSTLVR